MAVTAPQAAMPPAMKALDLVLVGGHAEPKSKGPWSYPKVVDMSAPGPGSPALARALSLVRSPVGVPSSGVRSRG